jgi:transcriptional regulator with XRE-family HTH domain
LGISTNSYAKIERGETDVNFSRLQQIANVMEIELPHLLGLNEKNVFNITCENNNSWQLNSSSTEQIELKHQLEKANLIIEQQKKEIDYLKQQLSDFRILMNLQNNKS